MLNLNGVKQQIPLLNTLLISAPILSFPREKGLYILDCDASGTGIGSVLSQIQDGEERVIAYSK